MDLHFETAEEQADGVTVVTVRGELDVATAPVLKDTLATCAERGDRFLVVDLREVPFLDSTGLGALVGAATRQRDRGGDLRVVLTEPRVARVFEITGLSEMLPIVSDLDAAKSALDR